MNKTADGAEERGGILKNSTGNHFSSALLGVL
jgi:hypothetical protein